MVSADGQPLYDRERSQRTPRTDLFLASPKGQARIGYLLTCKARNRDAKVKNAKVSKEWVGNPIGSPRTYTRLIPAYQ